MPRRPSRLEPLRARVRRLQLIVGAGLLSVALGAVFAPAINLRLAELLGPRGLLSLILLTFVGQLWAVAILPLVLHGLGRVVELRPWTAAIGAGISGLGFVLSLGFLTRGVGLVTEDHPARVLTVLATTALGILLSHRALVAARAAAARAQAQATQLAQGREDEYAGFLREAERVASRHDAER